MATINISKIQPILHTQIGHLEQNLIRQITSMHNQQLTAHDQKIFLPYK